MFKKSMIVFILLILTIGIVSASEDINMDVGAADSTIDVEKVSISGDDNLKDGLVDEDLKLEKDNVVDVSASSNTFEDLTEKIRTTTKSSISLGTKTYSGNNPVYVDKNITLSGSSTTNRAILDGKDSDYIITVYQGVKLTLKNIKFVNCKGFAISSSDAKLVINNCIFENNHGAVDSQSNSISIMNSQFNSNYENPTISLYLTDGTVTISKCEFNNNAGDYGGAIYISGYEGTFVVNILDSTFNSNSAKEGSALYISYGSGNIKNNKFINNKANDALNGVGSVDSNYVLENNTITSDIKVNENLKMEFISNPAFYGDVGVVKFTKDNKPLANKKIFVKADKRGSITNYAEFNVVTDSNGIAKFAFSSNNFYEVDGIWDFQIIADSGSSKLVLSDNNLNIKKLSSKVVMSDLSTTYASGKVFSFKVLNKDNNKPAANVNLYVTLYKNGYYLNNYKIKTDLNGAANVKISNLESSNYKLEITSYGPSSIMSLAKSSAKIKIAKAPTKVKAPKVTNKYKKSKFFKVTVKAYNKPVKSIKVKLKVYTGKKYKTYTIKTDKKGVAKLNTKKLKRGSHKVTIISGNSNYKISAKSKIKIK